MSNTAKNSFFKTLDTFPRDQHFAFRVVNTMELELEEDRKRLVDEYSILDKERKKIIDTKKLTVCPKCAQGKMFVQFIKYPYGGRHVEMICNKCPYVEFIN